MKNGSFIISFFTAPLFIKSSDLTQQITPALYQPQPLKPQINPVMKHILRHKRCPLYDLRRHIPHRHAGIRHFKHGNIVVAVPETDSILLPVPENAAHQRNGKPFGKDYFDELLERIREIRASERRAYQKITDIFEQCSYDYDKNSEITKNFYAFVQNKLHFAVTGKTAAELIYERADSEKPAMGLTTWKDAPDGKVLKRDIGIAKNYLNEKELSRLNRLVTMFIDYAELMAEDEILMSMQDWVEQTNQFLINNRREVLDGKGKISHEAAMKKAEKEYEAFRVKQDKEYISEFDREIERYLKGE